MAGGLSTWQIRAGVSGRGHVMVNDVDLSDRVTGLAMVARSGELPKLTLELRGEGTLEGEGIVDVIRDARPEDLRAAVLEWLSEIDPDQLAEEAMREAPMTASPVELVLAALQRMAAGL